VGVVDVGVGQCCVNVSAISGIVCKQSGDTLTSAAITEMT
jgi:hypothetical protein